MSEPFGHGGTNTWKRLTKDELNALPPEERGSGRRNPGTGGDQAWGYLRITEPTVEPRDLSLAKYLVPWHQLTRRTDGKRQLIMRLSNSELVRPHSLTALVASLHTKLRAKQLEPADPELLILDCVVLKLLDICIQLHKRNQNLGFIDRQSVYWVGNTPEEMRLVLPDACLTWGKQGAAPEWMKKPQFAHLWDSNQLYLREFDASLDLRSLVQLFDQILTNDPVPRSPIPHVDQDPRTKGQTYEVLLRVCSQGPDSIRNAKQLREALEDQERRCRLSHWFADRTGKTSVPRPKADRGGKRWMAWIGSGLGLSGIFAFLVILNVIPLSCSPPPPPPPPPICPDLSSSSELYPLAFDLDKARKNLPAFPKEKDQNLLRFHPPTPEGERELNQIVREVEKRFASIPAQLDVLEKIYQAKPSDQSAVREQEEKCRNKFRSLVWEDINGIGQRLLLMRAVERPTPEGQTDPFPGMMENFGQWYQRFKKITKHEEDPPWLNKLSFIREEL